MYIFPILKNGVLIKRYKRFFVDIMTGEGVITVHNPNTGSMLSLIAEGRPVLYSQSDNLKRKLPCTLELIKADDEWIITNTIRVNVIVEAAIRKGKLPSIYKGGAIRREFSYKDSRIDFLLDERTLVEVKSVTYFDDTTSYFPDAITTRGRKHLHTLTQAVNEGYRAIMLYVCMADRQTFKCASHIDPAYCLSLEAAINNGVESIPVKCHFDINNHKAEISTHL